MPTLLKLYLILAAVMSVIVFALYGWDKHAARHGTWRVRERTLFTLAVLGGWPGGLIGSRVFRHKTKKLSYRVVFTLIVLLHLAAISWLAWRWMQI